ncbi:MAG: carboxypeptidase-like regulatory domain-containing protein [Gemmatimonadaceae bacterium]
MRGRVAPFVTVLLACAAFARTARAQALIGVVHDSVSQQPVPGAVVILLDSAGGIVTRSLTNERGEYRTAFREEMRSARFVRIGFVPREVPLPPRTASDARLDVTMFALPSLVQPIRVLANSQCRARKDRADALGLWEQARAGLLATIVARDASPARMVRLGFDKVMDGNSDRVEHMRVRTDSGESDAASFVAAHEARDFVRFGFSTDSGASGTYFGPDADVLLNDAFAGAYCFELAKAGRDRRGQVGLRFVPAARKRGRVDIDGTLWIDTVARELRDVQFRYLNVNSGADRFHPGGYVSFRSLQNGVVLIDRWSIRVASAVVDTSEEGSRLKYHYELYAEEEGGELASASWPDGFTWRAPLGALRLHALTKDHRAAVGTVIALVATPFFSTVDATGYGNINGLLPGEYAVRIIDPRIAALGMGLPTTLRFRAAPDSTALATLIVPTTESSIIDRCVANHKWAKGDSVFTMGRVVAPNGGLVNDLKVTYATRPKGSARDAAWAWSDASFRTGIDGVFAFCHAFTPDTEIFYRVSREGVIEAETSRAFTSNLMVVRIPIRPPRR